MHLQLPEQRLAQRGTLDAGRIDRPLNLRKSFERLARNRKGTRRWILRDCFGDALVATSELAASGFELQGRGAMRAAGLEDAFALVACHSHALDDRVRGFIERRALPQHLRDDVDRARVGHGDSRLTNLRTTPLGSQGFAWFEKFEGTDGIQRTYSTYNAHHGGVYICVNTTGVHGGGIVRSVVPEGHFMDVFDEMPEADANGGGIARWAYGRVHGTDIYGWFPERAR